MIIHRVKFSRWDLLSSGATNPGGGGRVNRGPVLQQVWHDKDPTLLKGQHAEQRPDPRRGSRVHISVTFSKGIITIFNQSINRVKLAQVIMGLIQKIRFSYRCCPCHCRWFWCGSPWWDGRGRHRGWRRNACRTARGWGRRRPGPGRTPALSPCRHLTKSQT